MTIDSVLINRVIESALSLQQIPAPPFGEGQRATFVYDQFVREGLSDVHIDDVGNVLARLPGSGARLPLILSAHLDTVFPLTTSLQVTRQPDRIYGPGIGDNSIGVASLFGLIWYLKQARPVENFPSDLWLVANVGEEGLGNLRGMRRIADRFKSDVTAYIIIEGMGLGQIYHKALEIRRFRISVKTAGGHSWVDYGRPSAITEIARLIQHLTSLPVPARPRTTINIGTISGGTSVNTIAAEAHIEVDLRSENARTVSKLVEKIKTRVSDANNPDVQILMAQIGHRPGGSIPASHPLVKLASVSLHKQGIKSTLAAGSTDANIPLSLKYPAICVGITHGAEAHTQNEYIETGFVAQGLGQLVEIVKGALTSS